jgi:predicted acylesterase/phospholipase RssA
MASVSESANPVSPVSATPIEEPLQEDKRKRLWIVLPGGGIKGVFQAGFVKGFMDKNAADYCVDRVYGSSVGAVIAPAIASGSLAGMESIIKNIRHLTDIFEPWSAYSKLLSCCGLKSLGTYKCVRLVDDLFQAIKKDLVDEAKRAECYSRCHVVAWDILNKKETWFTGQDLQMGVRASCALPVMVPPVAFKDTLFADGGISELIPITKVISDFNALSDEDKKNVCILLIDCSTRDYHPSTMRPSNILSYVLHLMNDMHDTLSYQEFELRMNQYPHLPITVVRPDSELFNHSMDVDHHKIKVVWDHGVAKAKASSCVIKG